MDPIHPIVPTTPNIPPVSPSPLAGRVHGERRRERDPGQHAPRRSRQDGGEDYDDGDGDGFGEVIEDLGGPHIDVSA
jgi:hypothetical protein